MDQATKVTHMPIYVLIKDQAGNTVFEKTFKKFPISIGRSLHCDIPLPQFNWISRQHAVVVHEDNKLFIVDLNSSNGIVFAGRIYDRVRIQDGTTVNIGKLSLQFGLDVTKHFMEEMNDNDTQKLSARDSQDLLEKLNNANVDTSEMEEITSTQIDSGTSTTNQPYPPDPQAAIPTTQLPQSAPTELDFDTKYKRLLDYDSEEVKAAPDPNISEAPTMPTIVDTDIEKTVVDFDTPVNTDSQATEPAPSKFSPPKPPKAKDTGFDLPETPIANFQAEVNQAKTVYRNYPKVAKKFKKSILRPNSNTRQSAKPTMNRNRSYLGIESIPRRRRILEAYVVWKGQIFDTSLFYPGESVVVGPEKGDGLYLPTLRGFYKLAHFGSSSVRCRIPEGANGYLRSGAEKAISFRDLMNSPAVVHKGKHYSIKLNTSDLCTIELDNDVTINFRYAPAPRLLSRKKIVEPDALMRKTLTGSSVVHMILIIMALLFAPGQNVPKVKNLPPRVAKLLMKKPKKEKPKPKPPPKKKKVEKKIVKDKPKPKPKKKKVVKKIKRKPKRVIVKKSKKMKVINKRVAKKPVEKPVKGPPPKKPVDVKNLGALAALGALGNPTPNPKNQPVAINVNKNAGGGGAKSDTKGVIGLLKAKGGKLQAAGMKGLKTKGKGFGTGDGYGVQGLKGRAGKRGVAGSVVGTPKLMQVSKTEGLTRKQVMDVVKKNAGKIQQCYERALLTSPGLAGRVEYEWHITPKGKVKWAKIKKSDVRGGDVLNTCVLKVFKRMRFPVAKNGESTIPSIGFPFGRL